LSNPQLRTFQGLDPQGQGQGPDPQGPNPQGQGLSP